MNAKQQHTRQVPIAQALSQARTYSQQTQHYIALSGMRADRDTGAANTKIMKSANSQIGVTGLGRSSGHGPHTAQRAIHRRRCGIQVGERHGALELLRLHRLLLGNLLHRNSLLVVSDHAILAGVRRSVIHLLLVHCDLVLLVAVRANEMISALQRPGDEDEDSWWTDRELGLGMRKEKGRRNGEHGVHK